MQHIFFLKAKSIFSSFTYYIPQNGNRCITIGPDFSKVMYKPFERSLKMGYSKSMVSLENACLLAHDNLQLYPNIKQQFAMSYHWWSAPWQNVETISIISLFSCGNLAETSSAD